MTFPDPVPAAPGSTGRAGAADPHLEQLTAELDNHARIAKHLGVDLQHAVRALTDGYPDTAVTQSGRSPNGC